MNQTAVRETSATLVTQAHFHVGTSGYQYDRWRQQPPAGFCYALKYSRYGSHVKRLKEAIDTIGIFLRHAHRLLDHLGPILVQLPPNWKLDRDRLLGFLDAMPHSLRWAFEFRDPRWLCDEVFAALRHHNAALSIHDLIDAHPQEITADWTYLRLHGDHYCGSYTAPTLKAKASWIRLSPAPGCLCVHQS